MAQQLSSLGQDLFYWTSGATSEVDFLIARQQLILPLEVKAGVNTKSKSLAVYEASADSPLRLLITVISWSKTSSLAIGVTRRVKRRFTLD